MEQLEGAVQRVLLGETFLREMGGRPRVVFVALATPGGAVVTPGSPSDPAGSCWNLRHETRACKIQQEHCGSESAG